MLQQLNYKYYAFISYKREDEKWAKLLQEKLESFGFPVSLRKKHPSLPQKIRPVFRDQSELSGGNLKNEIEKGLEGSKYLIVICSPRSANSPWVSKEVQYFIDNGRENNIIPFIIGGSPNAKIPEDECFPKSLRQLSGEKEILGININEMGRSAALVKVIARMFNLQFDNLWQRHERAKRHRMIAIMVGVVAFALISLFIAARMTNLKRIAENESIRANEQTIIAQNEHKKALLALISLEIANDSIKQQLSIIAQANQDLAESNYHLAEERDKVIKANWVSLENQGKLIAEKALQLIDNGDAYHAKKMCLDALPLNLNKPNKPYVAELEFALRRALKNKSTIINGIIKPIGFDSNCNFYLTYRESPYGLCFSFWDTNTGQMVREFMPENDFFTRHYKWFNIAYNHQRNILANRVGGLENGIYVYNFNNGRVNRLVGYRSQVDRDDLYIAFSNDGKLIGSISLSGADEYIRLWDIESEKCIKTIANSTGAQRIAFDAKDKLIFAWNPNNSKTGDIIVIDIINGVPIDTITTSINNISKVKVGTDVVAIISDKEKRACIYYPASKTLTLINMEGTISDVAFDGHGLVAFGSHTGQIKIWNKNNGEEINYNIGTPIRDLSFSDRKELFVYSNHSIRRVRYKQKNEFELLFPDDCRPIYRKENAKYFTYHGKLVASSTEDSGILHVEDLSRGKINHKIKNDDEIEAISFTSDGKEIIIVSSDGEIEVWNAESGKKLKCLNEKLNIDKFTRIGFSKNGRYLICSYYLGKKKYTINILDLESKKMVTSFESDSGYGKLEVCPKGKYIVLANGRKIKILNMEGVLQKILIGHDELVTDWSFSPDGNVLASASKDKNLRIWDVKSGKCLYILDGHKNSITSIAFSRDGKLLASGDSKGCIRIWETDNYKCIDFLGNTPDRLQPHVPKSNLWQSYSDGMFEIEDLNFSDDKSTIYCIGCTSEYDSHINKKEDYILFEWKLIPFQDVMDKARSGSIDF